MKNDVYDLNIAKETQVKDKPQKVVIRWLVMALLFGLLVISYIFSFYRSLYPGFFDYNLDGTFTAEHYFGANPTDLVVIRPYNNVNDAEVGDIVCFYTSAYRGSGELHSKDGSVFVLETREGDYVRIGTRFIVGKQVKTIPFVGIIFAILFSYVGAGIFTAILLAYCCIITFSRINYENTDEGKRLYRRYRQERSEIKKRELAFKRMKKLGDVELVAGAILEGDFEENKAKFSALNLEIKGSPKDKYKYILTEVHDAYVSKKLLTKVEIENITSLVELFCEAKEFDLDMQYMLSDLLLKTPLSDFEKEQFKNSAKEMLCGDVPETDRLYFISTIYLILLKNSKLRGQDFKEIIAEFNKKTPSMTEENRKIAEEYAKNSLKLIKT